MEHTHDQSGERLLLVYLLFSVKTQVNNIDSPKSPFWSGSMLHKSCFTLTDTHGTVSSVISPNGNQKRDETTQITYFNSKTRPSTKHKSTILPTTVPLAWIFFFRNGGIPQPLHQPMHTAFSFIKILEFKSLHCESKKVETCVNLLKQKQHIAIHHVAY
jgi:hypothetical protein